MESIPEDQEKVTFKPIEPQREPNHVPGNLGSRRMTMSRRMSRRLSRRVSRMQPQDAKDFMGLGLSGKRTSRQLEALTMKAVCLQKRAWFTTLCCVFLCPILIIIVPVVFGIVYKNALDTSATNTIRKLIIFSDVFSHTQD